MKKPEKWQSWLFIVSLVVIAFIINRSHHFSRQVRDANHPSHVEVSSTASEPPAQTQNATDEHQKALREQEAKRARYVARYVQSGTVKTPGLETLAVLAATESRRFNSSVTAALLARLNLQNRKTESHLFTPDFLSDGLVQEAFADAARLTKNLDLAKFADTLVLAYQEVDYVTNTALENVITANMRLIGITFSTRGMIESRTWSYSANGAGFTQSDARRLAEERLLKQIANDEKFLSKASP